jgi:hypothetical protein
LQIIRRLIFLGFSIHSDGLIASSSRSNMLLGNLDHINNTQGLINTTKSNTEKPDHHSVDTARPLNQDQPKSSANETSRDLRHGKNLVILGHYTVFDLFIPGKQGFTLGYQSSEQHSWEVEFQRAKIAVPLLIEDFGSVEERRISLLRRSYWDNNSFSLYYGLTWDSLEIKLGSALVEKLSLGKVEQRNLLSIETIGLGFGVGNRWMAWSNFSYGVDWIGVSQPVFLLKKETSIIADHKDSKEARDIDRSLDIIRFTPRIQLLKIQAGFMF